MVSEENWGISPERVGQFLLSQPDVRRIPEGFVYKSCRISLTPVRGTLMGKWPHVRCLIRMEGPERDVSEIRRRIFLQFLSAGG